MYFVLKCVISGVLVALISEVGRRSSVMGAVLASLPLTSILALIWLYRDTHDVRQVAALSTGIAWIVLPSLVFFLLLSYLLNRSSVGFAAALALLCLGMVVTYGIYGLVLKQLGIDLS